MTLALQVWVEYANIICEINQLEHGIFDCGLIFVWLAEF